MKKAFFSIMVALMSVLGLGSLAVMGLPAGEVLAEGGTGSGATDGSRSAQDMISSVGGQDQDNLTDQIKVIINVVLGVVGLIAVVVIILGGITYTTSQGDSNKVKKAKDTILYGVIGLIVSLLAFAIVNFVLAQVFGS